MTTFHSEKLVARSDIEIVTASCNEPDAIGYEASWRGKELFSIYFEVDGRRSIRFGSIDGAEFDADEFRDLIDAGFSKLTIWDAELRAPGGIWAQAE
jgi:hypothetical protein